MNKRFLTALLTGAFFIASASMFVSCKDYDDDISKNTQAIEQLRSELNSLKTSLTSQLESAVATLNTAIAQKADQSELTKLEARVAALETQIKEIDNCAKKSDLEALAKTVAILTGDLEKLSKLLGEETAAREALEANFELQKKALEALEKKVNEQGLQIEENTKAIAEIRAELDKFATKQELEQLRADMMSLTTALSQRVDNIWNWINILNVCVSKRLTSLVLQPSFYWEGIEAVEVPFADAPVFVEADEYSFTYTVENPTLGNQDINVTVAKHMTWGGENCEDDIVWMPDHRDYESLTSADAPAATKFVQLSNGGILEYHINPTTADLEGWNFSFWEIDRSHFTRGNNGKIEATPTKTTFTKSDYPGGILQVPFKVNNDEVWNMFADWASSYPMYLDIVQDPYWWDFLETYGFTDFTQAHGAGDYDDNRDYVATEFPLPFLAGQFQKGDTVVTSDYAVVVPAIIEIVALADNAPEEVLDQGTFVADHDGTSVYGEGKIRANHLYESTGYDGAMYMDNAGAISMPATHSVLYNDPDGIDLKPFIETHFDYAHFTKYGTSTADQVMSDEMLAALGLHYEFTAIDYKIGTNETGESKHIEEISEGVFAARSVTADGNTIYGKVATKEAVDREPLVRVDLVDEDGNIVRYGYIKLRIVDSKPNDLEVTIDLPEYWMNCGDEHSIKWSQVENLILAKLGTDGMLKQDFEKQYYLEVYGGYQNMPYVNPDTDPSGELYSGSWMAIRYYKKADGSYALAKGSDTDETDATQYNSFTKDNNHFGEVWYTPHDNPTTAHNWDESTNVLIWNLFPGTVEREAYAAAINDPEQAGNMTKDKYHKLRDVCGVTYDNPDGTNGISTVVRFKHKMNGTSIYVTLNIPKVHFEYGVVQNKDWSHWWKMNTQLFGVESDEAPYWDEFDTHMNTPVPAYVGYRWLTVEDFKQDLCDYWHNPDEMVTLLGDASQFTKFYTAGKPNVDIDFIFVYPKTDLNSQKAGLNGTSPWVVEGVSGVKWTLKITEDGKKIQAIKKNGAAYGPEDVCELIDGYKGKSKLYFHGLEQADPKLYPAATDLVNKSGRYDETGAKRYGAGSAMGEQQDAEYLAKDIDETFTAFVKVNVTHDCYDPLIAKQYFNVRVLRPINVAGKEKKIKDIPNMMQSISIRDLVDIIDYRDIPVVGRYATALTADKTAFNVVNFPKWDDVADGIMSDPGYVKKQELGVPYEFYKITDLAVVYSEILSDHQAPYADREKAPARTNADVQALLAKGVVKPVKDIPSLRGGLDGGDYTDPTVERVLSLWSNDADHSLKSHQTVSGKLVPVDWPAAQLVNMTLDNTYSKGIGKLNYTNNSGITQLFHIYVPIAVKYNWGNIKYDEDLDPAGAKLDRNYTQTVWAVITVDPSYLGE